ncbi:hypothetical protein MKW92_031041 [Papaver armeniacum]|nr:hypothetical protein MKW92_031041 [Papaver armeniacum]
MNLSVKDGGSTAVFTVMGKTAEKMMKCTAKEHVDYMEQCIKINKEEKAQGWFSRIKDRTFVFKLVIQEYNINKQSDNFTVQKVFKSEGELEDSDAETDSEVTLQAIVLNQLCLQV